MINTNEIGRVAFVAVCAVLSVSCDPQLSKPENKSDEPKITMEESCDGVIAFPRISLKSSTEDKFEDLIKDLDLSKNPDDKECDDYSKDRAGEMVKAAILGADLPYKELSEFIYSFEWFTGSASEPASCESMTLSIERNVCGAFTSEPFAEITWESDGNLDEIKRNYQKQGMVDYQHPIKDCASKLWTLETCGGIFANSSNDGIKSAYAYEFSNDDLLVKGMEAYCKQDNTVYWVPVCDDHLSLSSNLHALCKTNFCNE